MTPKEAMIPNLTGRRSPWQKVLRHAGVAALFTICLISDGHSLESHGETGKTFLRGVLVIVIMAVAYAGLKYLRATDKPNQKGKKQGDDQH